MHQSDLRKRTLQLCVGNRNMKAKERMNELNEFLCLLKAKHVTMHFTSDLCSSFTSLHHITSLHIVIPTLDATVLVFVLEEVGDTLQTLTIENCSNLDLNEFCNLLFWECALLELTFINCSFDFCEHLIGEENEQLHDEEVPTEIIYSQT